MNEKEKMQRLEDDEESNGESESGFKNDLKDDETKLGFVYFN